MFTPTGELCSIAYFMERFQGACACVCREAEIGEGCVGDRGGV